MEKSTIEIKRDTEVIQGYGSLIGLSESDPFVLDKLMEFSVENNVVIYRHILRMEFIPNASYEPHPHPLEKGVTIPKGDRVYYLDIYYQPLTREKC